MSFTRKISQKNNDELILGANTTFIPDGVYILHETLGIKTVEGWNKKLNKDVVGILVVEDDHKIVVALEDSLKNLHWSNKYKLINRPVENIEDAQNDFNGEQHCIGLNSPDFPADYYCKTYNKGNRDWYLPSSGELWLIYRYLDEIQNALSIVGGQKFVTTWDEGVPVYYSSTEYSATYAWYLYLSVGHLGYDTKVSGSNKIRPVFNFNIKESFAKKKDSSNYHSQTSEQSVEFNSKWCLNNPDMEIEADEMHENVIKEISEKMKKNELIIVQY